MAGDHEAPQSYPRFGDAVAGTACDRRTGARVGTLRSDRSELAEESSSTAWTEGRAMTLDQAITCALEEPAAP